MIKAVTRVDNPINAFKKEYILGPLLPPKILRVSVGIMAVMVPSHIIDKADTTKYAYLLVIENGMDTIRTD
jgi:hypothetical protein